MKLRGVGICLVKRILIPLVGGLAIGYLLASCNLLSPGSESVVPKPSPVADPEGSTVQLRVLVDPGIHMPPDGLKIHTGTVTQEIKNTSDSFSLMLNSSQVVVATDSSDIPVLLSMGQTPVSDPKDGTRAPENSPDLVLSPESTAWALLFLGPVSFAGNEAQATCVRVAMKNTNSFKNLLQYLEDQNATSVFRLDVSDLQLVKLLGACYQELQSMIDAGLSPPTEPESLANANVSRSITTITRPPSVGRTQDSESVEKFGFRINHNTHWPRLVYIDTSADGSTYTISPTITGIYGFIPPASNKWYNFLGATTDWTGWTHLDTTTMSLEVSAEAPGVRAARISTYSVGLPGNAALTGYDSDRMLAAYVVGEGYLIWQLLMKTMGNSGSMTKIIATKAGKSLISKVLERLRAEKITMNDIIGSGSVRNTITVFFKDALSDKVFLNEIAQEIVTETASKTIEKLVEKLFEALNPMFGVVKIFIESMDSVSQFTDMSVVGFSQYQFENDFMVADPIFSITGGSYSGEQILTLYTPTPGAFITYTQGSVLLEPTANSTRYSVDKPIKVSSSTTISARAFKSGMSNSLKITQLYTIKPSAVTVTGISLNTNSLSLVAGSGPVTLSATISPTDADNKSVSWSSSNSSVATVEAGVVTPIASGSAIITVTSLDSNKSANCNVEVSQAAILTVATPVITPASNTPGTAYNTVQTVHISCATPGAVIRINNTSDTAPDETSPIFTEDYPLSRGQVIWARAYKSGLNPSPLAHAVIYVNAAIPVTGLTLNPSSLQFTTLDAGYQLLATVTPTGATNATPLWSTSNSSVATVTNSGFVTPQTKGTATITATCGTLTATCTVTVTDPILQQTPTPILSVPSGTYRSAQHVAVSCSVPSASIYYTTDGSDPTTSSFLYQSEILVSSTTTVRARAYQAGMTPSSIAASVLVIDLSVPATSVTLNVSTLTMNTGQTGNLTATVGPSNTTDKTIQWSSSNLAVATVSGGTVVPLTTGTVTITARCGSASASCEVIITRPLVPQASVSVNNLVTGTVIVTITGGTPNGAVLVRFLSPSDVISSLSTTSDSTGRAQVNFTVDSATEKGLWRVQGTDLGSNSFSTGAEFSVSAPPPLVSGTISWTVSLPESTTVTVSGAQLTAVRGSVLPLDVTVAQADTLSWLVDGIVQPNSNSSHFVFESSAVSLGKHTVTVLVRKGSYSYSNSLFVSVVRQ